MNKIWTSLFLLSFTFAVTGCGPAEVSEEAAGEAEALETDPDYEREMMGEMESGTENE